MISSPELIEDFYEKYRDKYPEISLKEMKLITTAPFIMMKEVMMEGNLEDVRIQHMFVIRVSQARVIKHLKSLYQRKKKGNITQKVFDKHNKMLLAHIDNNKLKFKKYERQLREITEGL
jgi:hypothetical protein